MIRQGAFTAFKYPGKIRVLVKPGPYGPFHDRDLYILPVIPQPEFPCLAKGGTQVRDWNMP